MNSTQWYWFVIVLSIIREAGKIRFIHYTLENQAYPLAACLLIYQHREWFHEMTWVKFGEWFMRFMMFYAGIRSFSASLPHKWYGKLMSVVVSIFVLELICFFVLMRYYTIKEEEALYGRIDDNFQRVKKRNQNKTPPPEEHAPAVVEDKKED